MLCAGCFVVFAQVEVVESAATAATKFRRVVGFFWNVVRDGLETMQLGDWKEMTTDGQIQLLEAYGLASLPQRALLAQEINQLLGICE
jgi:hypothetical protein